MELKLNIKETQKFICDFIHIYHMNPCLWKYSCKDYRNKNVKDRAYKALLDKMREIDPRADKNSVMRKINALRTAFRREFKKVRREKGNLNTAGRYPKRKYIPSLWYYDLLKFVVEQQDYTEAGADGTLDEWADESIEAGDSFASVDEDGKDVDHDDDNLMEFLEDTTSMQQAEVKIEPPSPVSSRVASPVASSIVPPPVTTTTNTSDPSLNFEINAVYSEKSSILNPCTTTLTTTTATTTSTTNCSGSNRREEIIVNPLQEPPPLAPLWRPRRLLPQQSILPQDSEEHVADLERFGAYVVAKLKRSSKKQSIIAEKVIAEVLMRANLGTLEETTILTDIKVPPPLI